MPKCFINNVVTKIRRQWLRCYISIQHLQVTKTSNIFLFSNKYSLLFLFLIIDLCVSIGCSHFCLNARSRTNYTCACHLGYSLNSNGKSCSKLVIDATIVSVNAPSQLQSEDIISGMIANVEKYDISDFASIYKEVNKFDIRNIAIYEDKLSFIEKKHKTVWH